MLGFGHGKAGRDVVTRMPGDAPDISVVQAEITKGCAISERCKIGRCLACSADNGRAAAPVCERDITANAHRLFVEGRKSAANRVSQMNLHAFDRSVVEILITKSGGIGGEALCQGFLRLGWRGYLIF